MNNFNNTFNNNNFNQNPFPNITNIPNIPNTSIYNNNFNIINNLNINRKLNGLNSTSKRLNLTNNPFKIKLKTHQEALLYKVLEIDEKNSYTNNPFGVMSDRPGSGKTYVVLALIYFSIKKLNSKGANIIVVPHNIYTQWVKSIENFLGDMLTYKLLLEYSDINRIRRGNML